MQYLKTFEQFTLQDSEDQIIDEGLFSTDWTNKEVVSKKLEKEFESRIKKYYTPYTYSKEKNKFIPVKEYKEKVKTKEEAKQKEGSAVLLNNKGDEISSWLIKGTPDYEKALEAAMKLKSVKIYYRIDTKEFALIQTGRFQTVN